jgi:hypothetical protein
VVIKQIGAMFGTDIFTRKWISGQSNNIDWRAMKVDDLPEEQIAEYVRFFTAKELSCKVKERKGSKFIVFGEQLFRGDGVLTYIDQQIKRFADASNTDLVKKVFSNENGNLLGYTLSDLRDVSIKIAFEEWHLVGPHQEDPAHFQPAYYFQYTGFSTEKLEELVRTLSEFHIRCDIEVDHHGQETGWLIITDYQSILNLTAIQNGSIVDVVLSRNVEDCITGTEAEKALNYYQEYVYPHHVLYYAPYTPFSAQERKEYTVKSAHPTLAITFDDVGMDRENPDQETDDLQSICDALSALGISYHKSSDFALEITDSVEITKLIEAVETFENRFCENNIRSQDITHAISIAFEVGTAKNHIVQIPEHTKTYTPNASVA